MASPGSVGRRRRAFPPVREVGLPVLEESLRQGLSWNDAGCRTLLALMGTTEDTNLMARGGIDAQKQTAAEAEALFRRFPDWEGVNQLDRALIARHLSPGGSADLLALCYLLHFLKEATEAEFSQKAPNLQK